MSTRGMATNVEARLITAVVARLLLGPSDSRTDLIGHWAQVAVGVVDLDKVRHDVGDASVYEEISWEAIILGCCA